MRKVLTENSVTRHNWIAQRCSWSYTEKRRGRKETEVARRIKRATSLSLFTFMHWRRKWQPAPVFLPGESQVGTENQVTRLTAYSQQCIIDLTLYRRNCASFDPFVFYLLAENNALSKCVNCSTSLWQKYLVCSRQASWMTVTVQKFIKWCPAA